MRKEVEFSREGLEKVILLDGRAIGLPEGATKAIAKKTALHVDKWAKGRGKVTKDDLVRITAKKLRELSPDLAYVYENRGKIL